MNSDVNSAARVAGRLNSAAIHLLRLVRAQDRTAPIGPGQLSALSVLVYGGPATVGQLARSEQVSSPTMSGLVRALEGQRLICRKPHPADRRSTVLKPTAAGRRVLEKARLQRIRSLTSRLEQLDGNELRILADAAVLMERIAATPD
jgi:DNA-binding MarR family transcriptional regulator